MSISAGSVEKSPAVLASLAFSQVAMDIKEVWRMISDDAGTPAHDMILSCTGEQM